MVGIAKKYKIRHAILTHLFKKLKYNNAHFFDLKDSSTSVEDLALSIKVSVEEVLTAHHGMNKHLCCRNENGKHILTLSADGIDAYIDSFWLREGQKDLNDRFYDKTKWIVPVLALLVTIGSILYSATKVQGMQEKVNMLQLEVEKSRNQYKPFADTSGFQGH